MLHHQIRKKDKNRSLKAGFVRKKKEGLATNLCEFITTTWNRNKIKYKEFER